MPFSSIRRILVLSYIACDGTRDEQRYNSKCLENLKEERNQQLLKH